MEKLTFAIGEKIIVIEHTYTGEVFEWDGEVVESNEAYVETKHRRNAVTHPQWHNYWRAYMDTYTKHYDLGSIKKK